MSKKQKIAIVYDWIDKWGGVERVLLTLREMFPHAEFFTSYYDSEKAVWAKDLKIKTSFIQKFPQFIRGNRIFSLPLYPYAFESFDFSNYDLVISVTSAFAKSIITRPDALHICYLLTPTRFLWFRTDDYIKNQALKFALSSYLAKLREWDFIASQRPDRIASISNTVADRCRKFYKRESAVLYPPFDISYWEKIKKSLESNDPYLVGMTLKYQKYFLVVSRLEPYKRVEFVLKTFNQMLPIRSRPSNIGNIDKTNLVIIGEGSEAARLKKIARENLVFLNKLTDQELAYLYSNAKALIMPQEEDFGYVSLEAQFFGCPVIAYRKGGATETVIEGKTGIFFEEQSITSLMSALQKYNVVKYELKSRLEKFGLDNIRKFSKEKFVKMFKAMTISKIK